jgi:hypothetical protein
VLGHVGDNLPWGWLAFALVAASLARYTARQVEAAEEARREQTVRRRPLRRRRALAQAKRSRALRAARDRRRMVRRLRRRRKFQAPDIEIDLRDSVLHDSVVTLETGDRLESGIVGGAPRR